MSTDQLYVVYMSTSDLIFQQFIPVKRARKNRRRDALECPADCYGFYYGRSRKRVVKITDLKLEPGLNFVDAIIVPTNRLAQYLSATGAYHNEEELMRNGGHELHAHTAQGRFMRYDPIKDRALHRRFVGASD